MGPWKASGRQGHRLDSRKVSNPARYSGQGLRVYLNPESMNMATMMFTVTKLIIANGQWQQRAESEEWSQSVSPTPVNPTNTANTDTPA